MESIGGRARNDALAPEKRKEIAQKAAAARWSGAAPIPKATHRGSIKVGDVEIPCFVLDDGRRVISGRGLTTAIGMRGRGQGIARISGHKMLKSNENNNLSLAMSSPIKFAGAGSRGHAPNDGFEATVLQELCEAK